ncbi:protein kinase domain-containing protein [Candidatus Pristimantibacillus sp. PTI5]|uniref:protein kinase domain-containing protein n=1 Tax=Candidatus Pristimantibacillus sp. PTI5 TaxID=3400422 RepID=UPI003B01CB97
MNLQQMVVKYKVFVDTSTWMHPPAVHFLRDELPQALSDTKESLKLPIKVMEEIRRMLTHESMEKREKAEMGAKLLKQYMDWKMIDLYGKPSDPFTDQTFLFVFQQFRVKYHLALITQDKGLAQDINNLNYQLAVRGNPIIVLKVDQRGKLVEWKFDEQTRGNSAPTQAVGSKPNTNMNTNLERPSNEVPPASTKAGSAHKNVVKLELSTKVNTGMDIPLKVSSIPGLNGIIKTRNYGDLRLIKEIGNGGEGFIYETSNGMVCKVYRKERLTESRRDKLARMLQIPIDKKGICWPKELVANDSGEFVGYLMDAADGKPMQTTLFAKPVLLKNFPNWKRQQLVKLAISILDKIEYLHDRNIIIGDINPLNILVKSETEVFLVDTDSYQIEGYPCPVGTINFTAPEIQGKTYSTFLRTYQHEHFAVATLVFMTLLPGKPPYSQQGGGTPAENIRNMDFPYAFGDETTGKAPDGPWRFIWSNLPYKLKETLYKTFKENNRMSTAELKQQLIQYLNILTKGYISDELFPTTHKIPEGKLAIMECRACGLPKQLHVDHKTKLEKQGRRFTCEECLQLIRLQRAMNEAAVGGAQSMPQGDTRRTSAARPTSSTGGFSSTRPASASAPPRPAAQNRPQQHTQTSRPQQHGSGTQRPPVNKQTTGAVPKPSNGFLQKFINFLNRI